MNFNIRFQIGVIFSTFFYYSTQPIAFITNPLTVDSSPLSNFENPRYISEPTTIAISGIYALSTNINFDPVLPNQSCITIDANDIILDLNRKTISQVSGNTQPGTIGITINPGVRNILIRNGSITDMSLYGIYINDGTELITLANIMLNNILSAGVLFDGESTGTGISNITCYDLQIDDVNNSFGTPTYGILTKFVDILQVTQCTISNLQTNTGNCYGIKVKNCNSVRLDSCIVTENTSGGQRMHGFDFLEVNPCLVNNCLSANNLCTNLSSTAVSIGYNFDTCQNLVCNNCAATSNDCTYTAIGFNYSNCSTAPIINCQSYSNTSSLLDSIGFLADSCVVAGFEECSSLSNNGFNNGYGILLRNLTNCTLENNVIQRNLGNDGAYGIALLSTGSCSITKNNVSEHVASQGFGIFDDTGAATSNSILGNYALQNSTNYSPGAPTIPVFTGPYTSTPSPFENISF